MRYQIWIADPFTGLPVVRQGAEHSSRAAAARELARLRRHAWLCRSELNYSLIEVPRGLRANENTL